VGDSGLQCSFPGFLLNVDDEKLNRSDSLDRYGPFDHESLQLLPTFESLSHRENTSNIVSEEQSSHLAVITSASLRDVGILVSVYQERQGHVVCEIPAQSQYGQIKGREDVRNGFIFRSDARRQIPQRNRRACLRQMAPIRSTLVYCMSQQLYLISQPNIVLSLWK